MTHYTLYQITNNLNGKIYVGVHKTRNLNDGYMGSGKVISAAIAKYGIENFTKVILETFENAEAMYAREKEIVTAEFLLREDTYNLRRGGNGGFDHINTLPFMKDVRAKNALAIPDAARRAGGLATSSENLRRAHRAGKMRHDGFAGKTHSPVSKEKISLANKGKGRDENNSQFGTMWITNGEQSVKIKKHDTIPTGWYRGRK